ncbi:MAG: protein-disulfide reductase DsbD [Gammaproteobacteria bacterium]|nr:protein-disulfide reductase DsbD [Gammaproteobacteria bacterium]
MRLRQTIGLLILLLLPLYGISAPLPEAQAFHMEVKKFDANTIKLDWTIKSGYFLYQKRISVKSVHKNYLRIGTIQYPEPEIKVSKRGKQTLIYRDQLTLAVPVLSDLGGEFLIKVHYQGCSDAGFCYPPQNRTFKLTFDGDHALSQINKEKKATALTEAPPSTSMTSDADIQSLFRTANPAWIILSFFGFGLLLAFTPCVLPMVPVLSSIIVGHGKDISTRKAFLLSLSYVLSMSLTYGVIGALIASLGANLQILMQTPWIIGLFSLIFVILALSMFDVYTFRLPLSWQTHLAGMSRGQESGHYWGAALMGAMSILILSPCVTPPLIGALSYIADSGSSILGLLALFFLGLGMGTPLLLLGASAGKLLPKAGLWMNTIKYIFGILLLGIAIHLLSRLVTPMVSMLLWSALFIASGLGLKPFFIPKKSGRPILMQALALMLIIFGGFILYGASAGHTNPWQPLSKPAPSTTTAVTYHVVSTLTDAQQLLADAKTAEKPVLLDFYATWCDNCQHMEKDVMHAPQIAALQDKIMLIQIDLSKNDADTQALLQYFNVIAPPTFLFYDASGQLKAGLQWVGVIDLQTLLSRIHVVIDT